MKLKPYLVTFHDQSGNTNGPNGSFQGSVVVHALTAQDAADIWKLNEAASSEWTWRPKRFVKIEALASGRDGK